MMKDHLNKEYLQMEGDADFRAGAKKLVFGDDPKLLERVRISSPIRRLSLCKHSLEPEHSD